MFGQRALAEIKAQYEARIAQYEAQLADLRKLVFSQTSASQIPLVALEADAILSAKPETIEIGPGEITDEELEADRILAGAY